MCIGLSFPCDEIVRARCGVAGAPTSKAASPNAASAEMAANPFRVIAESLADKNDAPRALGSRFFHAASYACFNQFISSASTSFLPPTRTRWLTIALKLPDFSRREVDATPFRLMPTSTRVAVVA